MSDAIGHVQIDPDAALMKLYEILRGKHAPKPGAFTTLDADQRRNYFREARRRSRARERSAAESGKLAPTTANIRDALADAALMILATGAPGADQVRHVLAAVFAQRPGMPIEVERKAKAGKLKPKLVQTKVQN